MKKEIITENAPAAIGPYSQAVFENGWLFVSGQLPIDPKTGNLVKDEIAEQTKQVLNNIEAILVAAGFSFEDVIKSEIYLKDMQEFSQMNAIYAEKFCFEIKPARQAFQVAKLPLNARIEISCIAKKTSKS